MLEDAAALAEKNGQPNARQLWANVASQEVSYGLTAKGLAHEEHVLQLYSGKDVQNHDAALGGRWSVLHILVGQKKFNDAEKLLREALAKTIAVAGSKSVNTQAQLVESFVFYAQQKRNDEALKFLDRALEFNLNTGETLSQSMTHSHCGPGWPQAADAVAVLNVVIQYANECEKTNPAFAKTILKKVMTAQHSALTKYNERLVPTLAALGDLTFDMRDFAEAEKYYDEAYDITKQYHKGEFAVRQVGKHYLENLRKLGKNQEADRLADLQYEGVSN
jgi:tetratricopeptide (TPR) repeat protein